MKNTRWFLGLGIGVIAVCVLVALALSAIPRPRYVSMEQYVANIQSRGKLLHQIRQICGDHPQNCPAGQFIAWLQGQKFEFETLEGITNNKDILGGDFGFTLYDPTTGKLVSGVLTSTCDDCDWWFDGYTPTKKGEHVRVDSYYIYDRSCLSPKCAASGSLDVVTKLPDIKYVEPIVPQLEIQIFINP